jgi:hypothetical protein
MPTPTPTPKPKPDDHLPMCPDCKKKKCSCDT